MEENNISTEFFQLDDTLETGKVNATINPNKEVTYEIVKPVAWDNIQWDNKLASLVSDADYFVFGSLATRSEITRNTLFKLLDIAKFKVLDINLRAPHYNRQIIEQLLYKINLLKLNQAELELITGWFTKYQSDNDRIKVLQDKFSIPGIVVTKGENGALFNSDGIVYTHPGYRDHSCRYNRKRRFFFGGIACKTIIGSHARRSIKICRSLGSSDCKL